jgi:hypothetical protein
MKLPDIRAPKSTVNVAFCILSQGFPDPTTSRVIKLPGPSGFIMPSLGLPETGSPLKNELSGQRLPSIQIAAAKRAIAVSNDTFPSR